MSATGGKNPAREHFLAVLTEELGKCSKCGSCTGVCPVYGVMRSESYCSRGKMMLARNLAEGRQSITEQVMEIFDNCLVCLACVKNCPGNVRMDSVVAAARAFIADAIGQPLGKKILYRYVMPKQGLMTAFVKSGSIFQSVAFAALPASSGLRRRFPLPLVAADQPVPQLARTPLRERFPEYVPPKERPHKGDIVYFTGCAANYMYPTIGEAVIHIIRGLGYGVFIPSGQTCCGTPMEIGGEPEAALELARKNIELLSVGNCPIITSCGSGGLMLRRVYPRMLSGALGEKAEAVASRVRDISEFIVDCCGLEQFRESIGRRLSGTVAYHASCHLERGLDVKAQPRALLHEVAAKYVSMPNETLCCGSGGTYGATHWDVSGKILHRKIAALFESGADVLATGCPSCSLQLEAGAVNAGLRVPVLHTAELAAWSMGYFPEKKKEQVRFRELNRPRS